MTGTFTAYQYTDTGLEFNEDYILEGEELRIVFQSGKLNGLDFGVTFNPEGAYPAEQLWEIVANEDYGRLLPDDVLKPEDGDEYILYGFDIQLVSDHYVPFAEKELLGRTEEYVKKSMVDDGIYTVTLRQSWVKEDLLARTFDVGQKINLVNPGYFREGNRVSRVTGWEMCLDIPYDNPVYTIGESTQYSRLGALEDKVDTLTYQGQAYTGGGGGVYVIRVNDSTPASDSNVFSALRTIRQFLRKDKEDSTPFLLRMLGGAHFFQFAQGMVGGAGGAFYKNESGRTYVEADGAYLRDELVVPQITFNCIDVISGDKANTLHSGDTSASQNWAVHVEGYKNTVWGNCSYSHVGGSGNTAGEERGKRRQGAPSPTASTSRYATTTRRRSGGTTSRNKTGRKCSSPTGRGHPRRKGRTPSPSSRTARCTSPSWQAWTSTSTSTAGCNPCTTE